MLVKLPKSTALLFEFFLLTKINIAGKRFKETGEWISGHEIEEPVYHVNRKDPEFWEISINLNAQEAFGLGVQWGEYLKMFQ